MADMTQRTDTVPGQTGQPLKGLSCPVRRDTARDMSRFVPSCPVACHRMAEQMVRTRKLGDEKRSPCGAGESYARLVRHRLSDS